LRITVIPPFGVFAAAVREGKRGKMRGLPLIVALGICVVLCDAVDLCAQEVTAEFKRVAPELLAAAIGPPLTTPSIPEVLPAQHIDLVPPPLDPTPVVEALPAFPAEPMTKLPRQWEIEWQNGLQFRSTDGAFHYHVGGRFDFDSAWFHRPVNVPVGSSDDSKLQQGTTFRRLRLVADGTLYSRLDFIFEANFANIQDFEMSNDVNQQINSVGITNVWLQLRDVPCLGTVRIGHFQDPIGLERLTSANAWYYMEYSPKHDAFFNPFEYSSGIMAFRGFFDERMTLAASLARTGQSTINPFGFGVGSTFGGTFRITGLPLYEDDGTRLVHIGFGASRRGVPNGGALALGDRALVHGGGGGSQNPDLLATSEFLSNAPVNLFNAEYAMVRGPFALSAEYTLVGSTSANTISNNQQVPHGDFWFHGGYVEVGLFVTPGDRRLYNRKDGTWTRTIPNEDLIGEAPGIGAFELVLRYSYLNLASGQPVLTNGSGARAGNEHDITAGLNWYLNPLAIVRLNYVWTRINSVSPGASGNIHALGVRLHFDF
jgi:phosphate-selective porin OprO and OprP